MASPAIAQERTADIRLPEMRLDAAVRMLSRQSGASIGFRDPSLASVRVRAVRGKLTASAALERALRGTGARARQVAAGRAREIGERGGRPARNARICATEQEDTAHEHPERDRRHRSHNTIQVTGDNRPTTHRHPQPETRDCARSTPAH
ncbi:STN domain-containing protein, partial [Sphingomonas koreensis]|uniref:STN domain-containing protein n=1 Tax=Sphingomonas koreensis TaxID=93064 RepID=UPI0019CFEC8D